MPGRASTVGVAGCKGKLVRVAVGGNQMMVAVGVALAASVGVIVAVGTGPEQPTNINPHTAISNLLPHF
jgi:hypothetical protein